MSKQRKGLHKKSQYHPTSLHNPKYTARRPYWQQYYDQKDYSSEMVALGTTTASCKNQR